MTHEVKNRESLQVGEWKYLFFSKPPGLWIQDGLMEKHGTVLKRSQREYIDLKVAGIIAINQEDIITIDGSGSFTVSKDAKDATMVADYLKTLPGIESDKVKILPKK